MKALSILFTLAAASAVHSEEDAVTANGSIRATRKATRGNVSVEFPVEKKREKRAFTMEHVKMHHDAYERQLTRKNNRSDEDSGKPDAKKDVEQEERQLGYKAKSGLSKLMWQDDGYRRPINGGNRPLQGNNRPLYDDDDAYRAGGRGGNFMDDNYYGGYYGGGKSGKSSGGGGYRITDDMHYYGGSGKSGKSSYMDDMPYFGGSGKSGKSSSGGGHGGLCQVTVTNLSYRQAFSKMFVMLHEKYVTDHFPLYQFGTSATKEMCDLTQNLNANGLQAFYNGRPGVQRAYVTTDFFSFDDNEVESTSKYLDGGATFKFMIRPQVDYISIASGFPFANDGGIVLQSAPIFNGAEYYLPAVDSGCEANLQTCWSVPASQEDFQNLAPRAQCADDDVSDTNNNDISGENFVSIHRGLQDLDSKDDVETLSLLECDQIEGISDDDNQRFAKYFRTEGYDDDLLLCAVVGSNGLCGLRVDDDFREFIKTNDDVVGNHDVLIRIARDSDDFEDFCDRIEDINNDLESAFKVLEPIIFDFRNPIARVSMEC